MSFVLAYKKQKLALASFFVYVLAKAPIYYYSKINDLFFPAKFVYALHDSLLYEFGEASIHSQKSP